LGQSLVPSQTIATTATNPNVLPIRARLDTKEARRKPGLSEKRVLRRPIRPT